MSTLVFDQTNPEHLAKRAFAAWNHGKGDEYLMQAVKDVSEAMMARLAADTLPDEEPNFTMLLLRWAKSCDDSLLFFGVMQLEKDPDAHAALSRDRIAEMSRLVPLGRYGRTAEVAAVIAFLCSPQAGYVTGQTIHVNGGLNL